jgi:hypothetical protein
MPLFNRKFTLASGSRPCGSVGGRPAGVVHAGGIAMDLSASILAAAGAAVPADAKSKASTCGRCS